MFVPISVPSSLFRSVYPYFGAMRDSHPSNIIENDVIGTEGIDMLSCNSYGEQIIPLAMLLLNVNYIDATNVLQKISL